MYESEKKKNKREKECENEKKRGHDERGARDYIKRKSIKFKSERRMCWAWGDTSG